MKVGQLIEQLQKHDPSMRVHIVDADEGLEFDGFKIDTQLRRRDGALGYVLIIETADRYFYEPVNESPHSSPATSHQEQTSR
jgi:hypothetical protein